MHKSGFVTPSIKMSRRQSLSVLAGAASMASGLSRAWSESADDFYRNKNVTLVIGAGEGGFYDLNGRLLVQYMHKYLPFAPTVIGQNMEGASQLRATEYAYNVAPRDGTSLLVVQPYVILDRLLDDKLTFDVSRMTWIGRVGPIEMGGIVSQVSGVKSIDDARAREVIMGADSPTGPAAMIPWALNRLAGTKFRIVRGYQSQTAEQLAMDREEIQGVGNGSLQDFARMKTPYEVLYLSNAKRLSSLPNVPSMTELGQNDLDRTVLSLLASVSDVGLTLAAPPDIPAERVSVLRKAFEQCVSDPDYRKASENIGFSPNFMSGSELTSFIHDHFTPSDDVRARLREAVAPV